MATTYKNIYVTIYFDPTSNSLRLRPVEGQYTENGTSIQGWNIRSSHAERALFKAGDVFLCSVTVLSGHYALNSATPLQGHYVGTLESEPFRLQLTSAISTKSLLPLMPTPAGLPEIEKEEHDDIPEGVFIPKLKWDLLTSSLKLKKYPFLIGPKGAGKSTIAKSLAKSLGADYFTLDLGQAFKPKKMFVGGLVIAEDGTTKHIPSAFLKAYTSENPTLIFLDEITRTPAIAANYLMTILDRSQSYIYNEDTGETLYKGKDVVFIAAGNMGFNYVSTQRLDSAFEDRFIKIQLDYLAPDQEAQLLMHKVKKLPRQYATQLVTIANSTRRAEKEGKLSQAISPRQLIDAGELLMQGFSVRDVFNEVLINNFASSGETETVLTMISGL